MSGRMKSNTQSVWLAASPARVFAYVSNPDVLPEWAPGFAPIVRRENDDHLMIQRGDASVHLQLLSDATTGVVDFRTSETGSDWRTVHSRIIPNGSGTEYMFALFQFPGMPDIAFDHMVLGMREELDSLASKVGE